MTNSVPDSRSSPECRLHDNQHRFGLQDALNPTATSKYSYSVSILTSACHCLKSTNSDIGSSKFTNLYHIHILLLLLLFHSGRSRLSFPNRQNPPNEVNDTKEYLIEHLEKQFSDIREVKRKAYTAIQSCKTVEQMEHHREKLIILLADQVRGISNMAQFECQQDHTNGRLHIYM